jgi:hypothetical protein
VAVSGNSTAGIAPGSTINGNLVLQTLSARAAGPDLRGDDSGQPGISSHAAAVTIGASAGCPGNIVKANVEVQVNTGPVQIFGNQISGILQCLLNTSITGGGNKAALKAGQCATF